MDYSSPIAKRGSKSLQTLLKPHSHALKWTKKTPHCNLVYEHLVNAQEKLMYTAREAQMP